MNDTVPQPPSSSPTPSPPASAPESASAALRSGMVAVVGRTNSGKSTLVNRIIGEKVSIVSPVAQTTRGNLRAVLTDARGQLVLIDTPGLHKAQGPLSTVMNRRARTSIGGVDVVLLVLDGSREPLLEDDGWMRRLLFAELPCVFLLNKADAGLRPDRYQQLWEAILEEKQQSAPPVCWMSASAATGEGVAELTDALFDRLPVGPLLFDAETVTDYPRKLAIGDSVREKFCLLLDDELPHALGVRVDRVDEGADGWDVDVTLFVHRPSQKAIVIGPKGRTIRTVRRRAEPELSDAFGLPVRLNLWVKIEKNWDQNHFLLRQMGYVG